MPRTTVLQVDAILGSHWDGTTDVSPFIEAANAFVNRVATCAISKGNPLSTVELELIERWMSAYYYLRMDPTYKSRSTASASGAWNNNEKDYLNQAMQLDASGCVNALANRLTAGGFWLGKPPSAQIDYVDRD